MANANANAQKIHRGKGFYAAVVAGLAVIGIIVAVSVTTGLPGIKNSSTTTVDGRNVTGKTASD